MVLVSLANRFLLATIASILQFASHAGVDTISIPTTLVPFVLPPCLVASSVLPHQLAGNAKQDIFLMPQANASNVSTALLDVSPASTQQNA